MSTNFLPNFSVGYPIVCMLIFNPADEEEEKLCGKYKG